MSALSVMSLGVTLSHHNVADDQLTRESHGELQTPGSSTHRWIPPPPCPSTPHAMSQVAIAFKSSVIATNPHIGSSQDLAGTATQWLDPPTSVPRSVGKSPPAGNQMDLDVACDWVHFDHQAGKQPKTKRSGCAQQMFRKALTFCIWVT